MSTKFSYVLAVLLLLFSNDTNKMFVQSTNSSKSDLITGRWVSLPGDNKLYVMSNYIYSYCSAKHLCESYWSIEMATDRKNNSFWTRLAVKLGIKRQNECSFWIRSPDISCPFKGESGTVVFFQGPSAMHKENRTANKHHQVLCMNETSIPTNSQRTTKTKATTITDHITKTSPLRIPFTTSSTAVQTTVPSKLTINSLNLTTSSSTMETIVISSSLKNKTDIASSSTISTPIKTVPTSLSTTSNTTVSNFPSARTIVTSLSITPHTEVTSTILSAKTTTGEAAAINNEQSWITIGLEEYFVNRKLLDYNKAATFCSEIMNSSLVTFLNPLKFFIILRQINSRHNSYWIGSHNFDKRVLSNDCLTYCGSNNTLTTSPCRSERMSVCSKSAGVANVSQLLETHEFKTMLHDMSVLKNETGQRARKLSCAKDARATAKAAGFTGVFLISSVITLMVLPDVINGITYLMKS